MTLENRLSNLKMIVLALENLVGRDGVVAQNDPEDPDGAIADVRVLAKQYGGAIDCVTDQSIEKVMKTAIDDLFPEFRRH